MKNNSPTSPASRQEPLLLPQWEDALHTVTHFSQAPPITVICGPKNSGKSTFSRLLLNSLLERYDKVGYLDTDVGQPEFSVPGVLSLHLLDECISDLMNNSIREFKRCCFFGDISSKRDPEAYLNYARRLYDYFIEKYHHTNNDNNHQKPSLPLIINTPGWVKGTGFDVLVELLRYVCPTHVIQMRISADSKNLPNGAFWLADEQKGPLQVIELISFFTDSFNRSVVLTKNVLSLRESRLFNYFKQCFPESLSITTNKELAHALASIAPYEVQISQVNVIHLHCQVPESEVFHSLNGTIVGLAASFKRPMTPSKGCTPWCVGLGIVRGIDVKQGLLYVITPVPPFQLEQVDLLLQGFIEIPSSLLQVFP
ncbi:Polynucleotide 5'-hydroxyl-kinase NOL9 [Apostasia shenzhenica]|uniref:Polynucleotide 5'-hydroxyl-kinase NOL9 n=1 Tax=Apostasia shenzhenica TaxID=1088818 RepID=A0A2I0B798_9ASPA|nr:Polynucleotide 5'-hydroxyl-kinase NOL9 [Apostasia shenzhenica]